MNMEMQLVSIPRKGPTPNGSLVDLELPCLELILVSPSLEVVFRTHIYTRIYIYLIYRPKIISFHSINAGNPCLNCNYLRLSFVFAIFAYYTFDIKTFLIHSSSSSFFFLNSICTIGAICTSIDCLEVRYEYTNLSSSYFSIEPFSFGGLYGTKSKFGNCDITGDGAMEFFSNRIKVTSKWTASYGTANSSADAEAPQKKKFKTVEDKANFDGRI